MSEICRYLPPKERYVFASNRVFDTRTGCFSVELNCVRLVAEKTREDEKGRKTSWVGAAGVDDNFVV